MLTKLEGCIRFAAYKAVGESQEKPVDYYENNLFRSSIFARI